MPTVCVEKNVELFQVRVPYYIGGGAKLPILTLFLEKDVSAGGLCVEIGQLFEILKQTCLEGIV